MSDKKIVLKFYTWDAENLTFEIGAKFSDDPTPIDECPRFAYQPTGFLGVTPENVANKLATAVWSTVEMVENEREQRKYISEESDAYAELVGTTAEFMYSDVFSAGVDGEESVPTE